MTNAQNQSANLDESSVSAGGNVEIIGGHKFYINATAPSENTTLEQLKLSLNNNRNIIRTYKPKLYSLILYGKWVGDDEVDACISNLQSASVNINYLIPRIQLLGINECYGNDDPSSAKSFIEKIIYRAKDELDARKEKERKIKQEQLRVEQENQHRKEMDRLRKEQEKRELAEWWNKYGWIVAIIGFSIIFVSIFGKH